MSKKRLHYHAAPLVILGGSFAILSIVSLQRINVLSTVPVKGVVQAVVEAGPFGEVSISRGVLPYEPPQPVTATASTTSLPADKVEEVSPLEQSARDSELLFGFQAAKKVR